MTALAAARQAIAAARCAAIDPNASALAWQDLLDWPAWALNTDTAARETLALRVAAQWYAMALRRCIDGRVLQQASRLVGDAGLQRVLAQEEADSTQGPAALPAPREFEAAWRDAGRALLLASVASPALRAAVAQHVSREGDAWPRTEGVESARARQCVAQALAWPEGVQ